MNCLRAFIPPLEVLFSRLLAQTLVALTWAALRELDTSCKLNVGFDAQKHAEYAEICCEKVNPDSLATKLWGMKSNSFTAAAWERLKIRYEEDEQKLVFEAGGFPKGYYKQLQDLLFIKPTRYFYGRGTSVVAAQDEELTKSRTPRPKAGFIDFSLASMIPYIFILDRLRTGLRRVVSGRAVSLLLFDLGDRGEGLAEAVRSIYVGAGGRLVDERCLEQGQPPCIHYQRFDQTLNIPLSDKLNIDLSAWIFYGLLLRLIEAIEAEAITVVPGWPTIAIVSYPASKLPKQDETRMLNIIALPPEEVDTAYKSFGLSAKVLGTETKRLARGLLAAMRCCTVLANRGADYSAQASALASRLLPAIESLIRGSPDRDLVYQVARITSQLAEKEKECSTKLL